ncbi:MAG: Rieske (2Fe-2S) protein [Chloroflexi bacterium]|nr:MAG: nitrite reductase [Phototrophicales bacterium]RMF79657.1 MAG: Rieske (2Fe-2S) protein [Chloroflexota bacterium]
MVVREAEGYVFAAKLMDIRERGCLTIQLNGHTIVFFAYGDDVYAVDNRCPHMGFPLDKGTVHDGILTCHWHHARFDLASGGTFDQWADDVPSFPVDVRGDEVWVDLRQRTDPLEHYRKRLRDGLERNLSLVVAKGVIHLLDGGIPADEPFRIGVEFGAKYRQSGWGQGLTILACMRNLLPHLNREDHSRALFHGLSAVASDSSGAAPRFMVSPLPLESTDIPTLKRWFRQFIEVRDDEGAERCVISAIRAGADDKQMADMMFAAATDHRYIQIGHPLDFTNKAFETLDIIGWEHAELVLSSLTHAYAVADRMEESNAWRHPIDLIEILDQTFEQLPDALETGHSKRNAWGGRNALIPVLLDDDPQAIADSLLNALREGCTEEQLAGVVAYAAALRVARFHTSNDFGDWDTALHTFTFANAVQHGLRRVNSFDLLRGVFDAAMSVYLDRFLNIPAARIPEPTETVDNPAVLLDELEALLNQQQQVNQAAKLVALYLHSGGDADALLAKLGYLLLREDRDFHTIQTIEAAFAQYQLLRGQPEAAHVLIAAARYLAAHSPTVRRQGQVYQIAHRLARGEHLFEDE